LCSLLVVAALADQARYDSYSVFQVTPVTEEQTKLIFQFEEISDSIILLHRPHKVGESVNVVVAPHKVPDFLQSLRQNEISVELVEKKFPITFR